MRPRGTPPMPNAMSRAREPVGTASTAMWEEASPSRMMAPRPNCFWIWPIARSRACRRSCLPLAEPLTIPPLCLAVGMIARKVEANKGRASPRGWLDEELGGRVRDEVQEDDRQQWGEVQHAQPGQELADGGEDGLRDVVQEDHHRVAGVHPGPGEDDADEDGDHQYDGQDLDEPDGGFDRFILPAAALCRRRPVRPR